MKKYLILSIIGLMLVSFSTVWAAMGPPNPGTDLFHEVLPADDKAAGHAVVRIPQAAVDATEYVFPDEFGGVFGEPFFLGSAVDPATGKIVQGYMFVRYKKGFGKPTGCNNDGKCQGWENAECADCTGNGEEPDTSSCYGFLAKGAKWKTIEPWLVDVTGSGLNSNFVANNLALNIAKWEAAANTQILGDKVNGEVDRESIGELNAKNEVIFADIKQDGVIAVAITWGIFGGRPSNRELVEWDQVYDGVDFDWSSSGEAGKMDFENIATHELGHSVGMSDLYTAACSEETMYGYADEGETKKRDLNAGDITGIKKLY